MGEEVRLTGDDHDRVFEWEHGLPNADDLTPLSQMLISSELLSAFNITPEPYRSMIDVNRASQNTLAELGQPSLTRFNTTTTSSSFDRVDETADQTPDGSDGRKLQRIDGDGGGAVEETEAEMDPSARVMKRQRLVWTPQLHKRFIEVVAYLGVKNAVPKTIMQLMNVEGLSRENVASHLQKYRLYLKRMEVSNKGDSDSSGNRHYPAPPAAIPYGSHMVQYTGTSSEFRSDSYPYNNGQVVQGRNWSRDGNGNAFGLGYQHGVSPNQK